MKKIASLFLIVFFGLVALNIGLANAELMKDENGIVKDIPQSFFTRLSGEEKKAVQTGKEIPAGTPIYSRKRTGLFHYIPVKEYQKVVIFNPKTNKIVTLDKKTIQKGKEHFSYYIPLAFIGLFLVGFTNYRISKYDIDDDIGFYMTIMVFFITLVSIRITPIPMLCFSGVAIGLAIITGRTFIYKICSIVYTVTTILSLFQ